MKIHICCCMATISISDKAYRKFVNLIKVYCPISSEIVASQNQYTPPYTRRASANVNKCNSMRIIVLRPMCRI